MIALVSQRPKKLAEHDPTGRYLGHLLTPRHHRYNPGTRVWACDNDAFSGFHDGRYMAMLERYRDRKGCRWVTAPDVVGDAGATAALFEKWEPVVRSYGYPVAYVAQNGIELESVPWERVDALFVGGTDEFKLGPAVVPVIRAGLERGKWVHVGRVNWWGRIKAFRDHGVHSVDGSSMARWPDVWLPHVVGVLANEQLRLEGAM